MTLKIELWSWKVNQFKVLSMVTVSDKLKIIGKKLHTWFSSFSSLMNIYMIYMIGRVHSTGWLVSFSDHKSHGLWCMHNVDYLLQMSIHVIHGVQNTIYIALYLLVRWKQMNSSNIFSNLCCILKLRQCNTTSPEQ